MTKYKFLDDKELSQLIKAGDSIAYTEVYERYGSLLKVHIYRKLADFDLVKDILQEIFTDLWEWKERLPVTSNLKAYLYTVARNRVLNFIAHNDVELRYADSFKKYASDCHYTTDFLIREKEFAKIIQAEIDQLSPQTKKIFRLSRFEQLSHKEISSQLQISEQTVSKQISNALKLLKVKFNAFFSLLL